MDPASGNQFIMARIAWVEVASALARREREGFLASDVVSRALDTLRYDLDTQYQVIELDRELADVAARFVMLHPLRAYDAVQLASAQHIHEALTDENEPPFTFLTADDRLLAVAELAGLPSDNPNSHC